MGDISTSSSSSSEEEIISSDEELAELLQERNRPKNENYFEQTVPNYNDHEFIEHFRVSRRVAESLGQRFENSQYFNYQSGGNWDPFNKS